MVSKVEAYSAATLFSVQARFTCCHNTVATSTALSAIVVNNLQTGIKKTCDQPYDIQATLKEVDTHLLTFGKTYPTTDVP
jgi:hypothetical protein